MELNTQAVAGPLRSAATLVVLRDGPRGIEVLLLKRHAQSAVLGGAHVFPGGKVDTDDAQDGVVPLLDQSPEAMHIALNETALTLPEATALYVAALREAFEESHLLFSPGASSADADRVKALLGQGQGFAAVLAQLGLGLATTELLPWSRWITPLLPSVSNKRFDTRFFVARAPAGQQARHDDHEATDSVWLTAREALAQYWQSRIEFAPPQIMSLVQLARQSCVQDVLAAARLQSPPVIQPEPFVEDGTRTVCYPGDARHPVAMRALAGPTRLIFRNKRFEPPNGLADLLA